MEEILNKLIEDAQIAYDYTKKRMVELEVQLTALYSQKSQLINSLENGN